MKPVLSQFELHKRMKRFLDDPRRPISIRYFAELAGLSYDTINNVFVHRTYAMTPEVQTRISYALHRLERGDVEVMVRRNRTRFLKYNETDKPVFRKTYRLELGPEGIKLGTGLRNRADYSHATLKEQFDGD